MIRISSCFILTLAGTAWLPTTAAADAIIPVEARESALVIPTYPIGPEDVNPRFPAYDGSVIYPYTMQDHLSAGKEDKTYRTLELENEYLRVTCLPEIGSRIHSVVDKTTNEEMFDTNEVIKPGLIGLRGAWVSGGIEWNAGPQAHTVTSYSPCDATLVSHRDGSASLVMGNIEMVGRTRWTVWLTLRPGRSYLEERIRMENPTDTPKVYYFWNNTAFPCHDGTRFVYPMTLGTDHNGTEFFTWPLHNGNDLTWLKNYDRPTSVFAYECEFDFFGAYDTVRDRGIVQVADHRVLVGKKAWTWGVSDDGLISMANLTDDGSRYIEVQSGPLETQADYGLLNPHQHIEWDEWWYPVHGLGEGFEFATKDVAIQTIPSGGAGGALSLRIAATGDFPASKVILHKDGKPIPAIPADLSPRGAVVVDCGVSSPVTVTIQDSDGNELAAFTTPLDIPVKRPPANEPDNPEKTASEHFLEGVLLKKQMKPMQAKSAFEKAIAQDAYFAAASRELGVLALDSFEYTGAIDLLGRATSIDADDGLAWYYLGVAQFRNGDFQSALDSAGRAIRTLASAGIGYDLAGRAHMRLGNPEAAALAFQHAVNRNEQDTQAENHLMMVLRAAGDNKGEQALALKRIIEDPLDLLPHLIHARYLKREEAMFDRCMEMIGEDVFECTEASIAFAELGMFGYALNALQILEKREAVGPKPMVHYMAAYYAHSLGEDALAAEQLNLARTVNADYEFPSRPELLPVLNYAIQDNPNDARAHMLLGHLYASAFRTEEASQLWSRAVELDPTLSVAHRALAFHRWKKSNDKSAAEGSFRAAIEARPADQTLYRDLAGLLSEQGRHADAISLLESMPVQGRQRLDTVMLLAEAYNSLGRHADALALLEKQSFSNWELNTRSRAIFVSAHTALGKLAMESGKADLAATHFQAALTYPAFLGVGKPAEPQDAESYFWLGQSLLQAGKRDEARQAFTDGKNSAEGSDNQKLHKQKCSEALANMG
ncbi:MAG: hypothetical protein AMXMBFR84_43730 [Candidatus Hydrogenedentota bacterium]